MSPQSSSGHASPLFESTRWSMILAARERAGPGAEAAMASLCATYWRPLYTYVRRQGHSVEDAQDLTQSFFSMLLEKDSLRRVSFHDGSAAGPITPLLIRKSGPFIRYFRLTGKNA